MTQLSFFINSPGRAEALRHHFVAHEGRCNLIVELLDCQTIQDVGMAALTDPFVALVTDRLVDPGLADWLLPTFTTTTPRDRSVAASVFLDTIKRSFSYDVMLGCGFPSVTMHGERSDWVALAAGVSRLSDLAMDVRDEDAGSMREWVRCLGVAVQGMIRSFNRPD